MCLRVYICVNYAVYCHTIACTFFIVVVIGCVHNGSLYISGGHTGVAHTNAVNCFRPKVGKWVVCAPLCTARSYHTMTAFRDQLYVIGGCCTTAGDVVNVQVFKLHITVYGSYNRLQTLVDSILPPTTAITDYAIGLEKLSANRQLLSANRQFFVGARIAVTEIVTDNSN